MMRESEIKGWAIPILLALLLNGILFLCIPSLSSRREVKKTIDFSDPILLSSYELPPIPEIREIPRPPEEEEPPKRVPATPLPEPHRTAPRPQASAPIPERKPKPKPPRVERQSRVKPPSPAREARSEAAAAPMAETSPVPDSRAAKIEPLPTADASGSNTEGVPSHSMSSTTEMGIGEVDQIPVVIAKVEPAYPPIARRQNREGKVVVRFLVDDKGRVKKPSIVEADPKGLFENSVIEAIGKWRFKPGQYRGRAVSTWIVVPIYFKLTG